MVDVDAERVVVVVLVIVNVCVVVTVAFEAGVIVAVIPEAIFVPANAETGMFPHIASDPETAIPDAGTHPEPSQYCIVRLDGGSVFGTQTRAVPSVIPKTLTS